MEATCVGPDVAYVGVVCLALDAVCLDAVCLENACLDAASLDVLRLGVVSVNAVCSSGCYWSRAELSGACSRACRPGRIQCVCMLRIK